MNRKIYIRLMGGMGNQIFQYAFSLRLRAFGFQINGFWHSSILDGYGRSYLLDGVLKSPPTPVAELDSSTVVVRSESLESIVAFLLANPNTSVLLQGYFQNIAYIQGLSLGDHFVRPRTQSPLTAVHVRRAEYGHHGLLPVSYYEEALATLNFPAFVVYSDEPNYAEYMFGKMLGYKGTVRPDLNRPGNDFLTLSSHSAIVMANSSFSWLAAFLAFEQSGARVVYPTEWTLMDIAPGGDPAWLPVRTMLIRP